MIRFSDGLRGRRRVSIDLWRWVKPLVRQVEDDEAVLVLDDSIEEKLYTDENGLIAWHDDHSKDRMVKGINFLSGVYCAQGLSLPIDMPWVAKTERYQDKKTDKDPRRSPISKNKLYRQILRQAQAEQLRYRYVLNDIWYASAENMRIVKHTIKKDFVMPLKAHCKVALSGQDKGRRSYQRVDTVGAS